MKLLQIGPYPPPLGGWSFHIKVFQEYLNSRDIVNEILDIGESRKSKRQGCVDVQNGLDYALKVFRYSLKGYEVYIHLNGNALTGIVLTLIAQLTALLSFRRCLLSFHAGVLQKCFQKKNSINKLLTLMTFHMAKGVICNSDEVREEITRKGIKPEKVYAIPCFSMQYVQHEKVLTNDEEFFLSEHSPVFSSYLFFRPEYDPETLLQALVLLKKIYPQFGAVIIGSEEDASHYRSMLNDDGLRDSVFLTGEKTHDNFLSLVEKTDVFIRTPMSDGVCSSVMEALALKIPVVGSDNKTRPSEVVLFEQGNPEDLAQKITWTMENYNEVKRNLEGVFQRDAIKEELEFLRKYAFSASS